VAEFALEQALRLYRDDVIRTVGQFAAERAARSSPILHGAWSVAISKGLADLSGRPGGWRRAAVAARIPDGQRYGTEALTSGRIHLRSSHYLLT
jgi:hypothetical protein